MQDETAGGGRVDLEKMRKIYEATREEAGQAPLVTLRAVARVDKDLHMVGRVGRFEIESDEPRARGGGEAAPSPLQYLLAGAAF